MKIGDETWLRKLSEIYEFPCKIAFSLLKENDGEVTIVSKLVNSKAKISNVKYYHAYTASFTSEGSALLSVKEINDAHEYLQETKRLRKIWGFALTDKGED